MLPEFKDDCYDTVFFFCFCFFLFFFLFFFLILIIIKQMDY